MPAAAAHPEQLEHEHEQEEEGTKLVESVPQGTAKAKAKAKAKTKSQSPEGRGSDEHDKKEKHGQHQHDHAAVVVQAPIEPSEGPGEEGEFVPIDGWDASSLDDDSGFGGSGSGAESVFDESGSAASSRSSAVSVTSSVYAHEYEHGRRYHSYRHGRYPIPNDDTEQNREDMKHAMVLELTDGRLFYAPIGDNPQRIIDIGTGTGMFRLAARPGLSLQQPWRVVLALVRVELHAACQVGPALHSPYLAGSYPLPGFVFRTFPFRIIKRLRAIGTSQLTRVGASGIWAIEGSCISWQLSVSGKRPLPSFGLGVLSGSAVYANPIGSGRQVPQRRSARVGPEPDPAQLDAAERPLSRRRCRRRLAQWPGLGLDPLPNHVGRAEEHAQDD